MRSKRQRNVAQVHCVEYPAKEGASESQMLLGRQHCDTTRGSRVRGIFVNAQSYFGRRNEVKT